MGRRKLFEAIVHRIKSDNKNNLRRKFLGKYEKKSESMICKIEELFGLNEDSILGMGTSCITFKYGSYDVIKVCSKDIKSFRNTKNKSIVKFQQSIAHLGAYLLPIKQVIYESDEFFAYIQSRCDPLYRNDKMATLSPQEFAQLLTIIQNLFSSGFLIGQLKPKNLGYINDGQGRRLVLFDYHSMHSLNERKDKGKWWHSLVGSLKVNCCLLKASCGKNDSSIIRKDKIKKLLKRSDSHIPKPLEKFFDYVKNTSGSKINSQVLCNLLEETKYHLYNIH